MTKQQKIENRNYLQNGVGIITGTKGEKWVVDEDVFYKINKTLWCTNHKGYAVGRVDGKKWLLHRFILQGVKIVDHINRNPFHNRLANLRDGGDGVNVLNKILDCSNTKSKIRGISKCRNNWQVRLFGKDKRVYLGTYNTIEKAKEVLFEYAEKNNLLELYKTSKCEQ